jgi:hypothetical protein
VSERVRRFCQPCWGDGRFRAWFACAFALVWFASTFFLLGDIGFWNDDYFMAEPAALGERRLVHVLPAPTPFDPPSPATALWRPLLTVGVTTLVSYGWNAHWFVHLVIALAHAGTALLLFALLRELGRSRWHAAWWSLLYLAWPAHYEVALWANGFLTGVATGAALACALACAWWARLDHHASRSHRVSLLGLVAICAIVLVSSNEQPAGALLALPLLHLACRRGRFERGSGALRELTRLAAPLLVIGVVLAAGVGLLVATQSGLGAARGFVALEWWPRRWVAMMDAGWRGLLLRTVGTGASRLGIAALLEHPVRAGLVCLGTAATIAGAWVLAARGAAAQAATQLSAQPSARDHIGRSAALRNLAGLGAGVLMFVGACVPLAMVHAHMRPRMTAVLLAASAVCLSMLVERIARLVQSRRPAIARSPITRAIVITAASLPIAFGMVSMVGLQGAFQARWRHDLQLAAALRDKLAGIPPDSILMPLRCDDWPVRSGHPRLDAEFTGPFYWSFAYPSFARIALNDPRLSASFVHPDVTLAFAVTPTHVLRHGPMPWPNTLGHWPVPPGADAAIASTGWKPLQLPPTVRWTPFDRCVPFITRPDGGVDPITELAFRQGANLTTNPPEGGEIILRVTLPRTTALADAGRFAHLSWIIDLPEPPPPPPARKPRNQPSPPEPTTDAAP